ncbi:C-type lectin fold [Fusarium tjaetaba]|uniref:C-type lectin fold n=1 Tax=Fusarium tjaetaba TaxID=1567544 RepID=A0A8H5QTD9_9HYPO|nr:C-type lectin fold [Fusarium tjaetaba]KAF5620865.1 C-type lectin fold [Fusarium tjaetaba]
MESKNPYAFPLKPEQYAPNPVRSLAEWKQLWSVWDLVTTKMISPDALMEQPIPLRNPLLFYLGHIPTLSESTLSSQTWANSELSEDIHLARARLRKARKEAASRRLQNPWIKMPEQTFTIGYHDPESDDGPNRFFAWDNEREPYDITVPQIEAQGRPVSNGEYAKYLVDIEEPQIPATWSKTRDARSNEDYTTFVARHSVKTVWGPVPLSQALDWPVMASFDEVERYSGWAGARLPTLHELRSIHEYVELCRKAPDSKVNHQFHTNSKAIFVDLSDTNSGFLNFHPTGITHKGDLCGLGNTGGAAEWTRTLFAPQPGFKAMDIYPGYSADFMDEKHMAVVGGSWALHPRIAGRKSFLNWWQKKYLWPWVTFRLTEVDCGICGGFVDALASPVVTSYDIN